MGTQFVVKAPNFRRCGYPEYLKTAFVGIRLAKVEYN